MVSDKCECIHEFSLSTGRGMNDRNVRERKYSHHCCNERAEYIDPEHHLLASHFISSKDLILRRVDRAVQHKVDQEIRNSNEVRVRHLRLGTGGVGLGRLGLVVPETHKDGDASRDHEHDEIFVRCESSAVEKNIHDHHWDQFAGLAKHHGGVGDVGESCKPEWCSECDKYRTLEEAP